MNLWHGRPARVTRISQSLWDFTNWTSGLWSAQPNSCNRPAAQTNESHRWSGCDL